MTDLTLILGNKNYSSWSMRAWLAARATGASFDERVIPLQTPTAQAEKDRLCPAGRVPVLVHGNLTVWDSLAIGEYLAEAFPRAGLWPADPAARAVARSACAEMHAGFAELRSHMPMNCRASFPGEGATDAVAADVRRITALWRECRARFGRGGAFLFGAFSLADAFFAPVVSRFRTYAVDLDAGARDYATAVLEHPDVAAWHEAARAEPWTIERYEIGRGRTRVP